MNIKYNEFYTLIRKLRSPDGCPWDREQSLTSLREYLLEECYETISAINMKDYDNIREELGDILLIITMMSVIAEEEKIFTINEVVDEISEKIIRRHPHVFGDEKIQKASDVVTKWQEIKTEEKKKIKKKDKKRSSAYVSESFPEIERALRIQKAAKKKDFDWEDADSVFDKIDEEINEVKQSMLSGKKEKIEEEIGDLLFTVVNLSRKLKVHPSVALHGTNEKFIKRFGFVEEQMKKNNLKMHKETMEEMESYWKQSKDPGNIVE